MYTYLLHNYEPADEHMELLLAHVHEFHHRLKLAVVREQHQYTLNLNECEALAFRQLWCSDDVDIPGASEWSAAITRSIVELIDKSMTNRKVRTWKV
jgi:hypothetical protein